MNLNGIVWSSCTPEGTVNGALHWSSGYNSTFRHPYSTSNVEKQCHFGGDLGSDRGVVKENILPSGCFSGEGSPS